MSSLVAAPSRRNGFSSGVRPGFGSPRRGSVKVDALGDADDEVPLRPALRGGGKCGGGGVRGGVRARTEAARAGEPAPGG